MFSLRSKEMHHMSLYLLKDDVHDAAVILAQSQSFDISKADIPEKRLAEHYEAHYARTFDQALERYRKIVSFLDIKLNKQVKDISNISYDQLEQTNEFLADIWNQCALFEMTQRKLNDQKRLISHLKAIWKNIAVFDVDLSLLDKPLQFLDVRLGTMPSSYVNRLKKSLALEGYHLSEQIRTGEYTHVVIAGMKERKRKIQTLLDAASFQNIKIPPELQGNPEKVNAKILELEHQYHAKQLHFKQNKQILLDKYIQQLINAGDTLALAKPYRLLSQQMRGMGELIKVNGWVLRSEVDDLKRKLHDVLGKKAIITTREPEPEEFSRIPSEIKHSQWIAPFMRLIRHYGIPRYNEFDPSLFFTLSYILMFGAMFGDIGHGLCFMLIALLLYKKWPEFSSFLLPIGLSSVFFGFLYGSVFCYEHLIPSIWMSPLSDPTVMLKMAFWWGVVFIIFLNAFSIYNRISARQVRHALFDSQGIAGMLLYFGMLWVGYSFFSEDFINRNWLWIILPLVFIATNKWVSRKETYGERLIIILIESYEMMINYLANTVSFLRLAAFSLNHVALAITVFTLADMQEGGGYWLAIVAGNLFILILEGAVVAIQTLRLEYYEGFSRFFYADGYQFEPLTLSPQKLL